MKKQVTQWTRACPRCQKCKVTKHIKSPLQEYPPADRFAVVHVDIVGPLMDVQGYRYLLTCVDRCTRWPEALPLKETTSTEVARTFINGWISRFGVPRQIISDRGAQFTSRLWTELGKYLGVSTNHTAAYHPQANGMVERFHRH